jgi:hypothetical protein
MTTAYSTQFLHRSAKYQQHAIFKKSHVPLFLGIFGYKFIFKLPGKMASIFKDLSNMDMAGKISVKLDHQKLMRTLTRLIPGFDPARLEIIAIRVFAAKEFIVTVYAADKENHRSILHEGKKAVKKFKLQNATLAEFYECSEAFNFTLGDEHHDLDEMEIINK